MNPNNDPRRLRDQAAWGGHNPPPTYDYESYNPGAEFFTPAWHAPAPSFAPPQGGYQAATQPFYPPQQAFQQQGFASQQGPPPQGFAPQHGLGQQGPLPRGFPPQQSFPAQGFPPQGFNPHPGYPPQQGYGNFPQPSFPQPAPPSFPSFAGEVHDTMARLRKGNKSKGYVPPRLKKKAKAHGGGPNGGHLNPNLLAVTKKDRRDQDRIKMPTKASGGVPNPTEGYLLRAALEPTRAQSAQPLLVVMDLNGTLLYRPQSHKPRFFHERPGAREFLDYCINNFTVVVWSSAKPENVEYMCKQLFTDEQLLKVVAVWGRDRFGLSPHDYNQRTLCFKRLAKLWEDPRVAQSYPDPDGKWDQGNTVLIDDSEEKAKSEPYNAIKVPEFLGRKSNESSEVLSKVHAYLVALAWQTDVSTYIKRHPFTADIAERTEGTGESSQVGVAPANIGDNGSGNEAKPLDNEMDASGDDDMGDEDDAAQVGSTSRTLGDNEFEDEAGISDDDVMEDDDMMEDASAAEDTGVAKDASALEGTGAV
ncbi:hypothetical protein OQA88_4901 [Cercophora sp. LCS_1]